MDTFDCFQSFHGAYGWLNDYWIPQQRHLRMNEVSFALWSFTGFVPEPL